MTPEEIHETIAILRKMCRAWPTPAVTRVAEGTRDPFKVLISCIISLRTRDEVTASASHRVFEQADTPEAMQNVSEERLSQLIYPAGFYKNKASQIVELSRRLVLEYGGKVPDTIEELMKFKGVGRKTANLVVTIGYNKPGICVDTHVHRICNRWGYVSTRTPEETEMALREKLPQEYWLEINDLLVAFGQNQCCPLSPRCSSCGLKRMCRRVGVHASR